MASLRQRVISRAQELGVTLDINYHESGLDIVADAPRGMVFRNTDTHSVVASAWYEPAEVVWRAVLDDLDAGVVQVDPQVHDPECDICAEERGEP